MNDLELQTKRSEFSIKLCAAIKKHKCLYDRIALHKNPPRECRIAWEEVAKECKQSINTCKSRWRDLQKSFFQGIKRRGSRYYLHDHMDFLLNEKEKKRVNHKKEKSAAINDETSSTNSLQPSIDEDLPQQETIMDTINIDDDDDEENGVGDRDDSDSDSHTTSADESNEFNINHDQITDNNVGGIFIIDEIGQEVDEDGKRLNYKRACKRRLDTDILNDETGGQLEPGEKRKRRSATGKLTNADEPKNINVRMDKIKINKPCPIVDKNLNKLEDTPKTFKRVYANQMVDRSTSTDKTYLDVATQYDTEATHFDNLFIESIKSQLQLMNARQKMNFKRRIYEAFLEVFDDNTDFPKDENTLKLPPKAQPEIVNTTVGELRLMRELVALVQSAKNTPEIINNKEKVKTSNNTTTPVKTVSIPSVKMPLNDNRSKTSTVSSPISLSPSLDDDDDLQFSLDNIDDEDDIQLPKSWDEIKQKVNDDNKLQQRPQPTLPTLPTQNQPQTNEECVMGLPRRVLQKVVRVAGSSGSTIVARDGDRKRIYRIYPKATTPNGLPIAVHKSANNASTYFVTPNKNNTQSPSTSANKTISNNITIKNLTNKPTTPGTDVTNTNTNNLVQTSNKSPALNNQTVFKNIHPANRILSSSTGFFKMVQTTKNLTPTINKPLTTTATSAATTSNVITRVIATKSPMMPPNIPQKRQVQVRSHVGSQMLAQRRFSLCGPMPSDKIPTTISKSLVVNQSAEKSSVSKIHISEPISLNSKAPTPQQQQQQPSQSPLNKQSNSSSLPSSSNSTTPKTTNISTNLPDPKTEVKSSVKSLDTSLQGALKPLNNTTKQQPMEEMPILETAGTIGADNLDPLFVKPPQIKSEPLDN